MSTEKAMERVCVRMETLSDLHSRGIVQGTLFKKQIKTLLTSRDSHKIFQDIIESDRKAIKILNRLEDPEGWRELTMQSRDDREESFYQAIENIMDSMEESSDKLIRMLQLSCLPHFTCFLPLGGKLQEPAKEIRPSRVSVLD